MKKLPKFVELMGRIIPIKLIAKKELDTMINGAEGIWDTYTRTIYINKEAPLIIQKYYVYHEMGHAMKTFTGLDQVILPELQEVIVQSYATLIEDVLKQTSKLK